MMFTIEELVKYAEQREQWATDARKNDLHGSAKEWETAAAIARLAVDLRALINNKQYIKLLADYNRGHLSHYNWLKEQDGGIREEVGDG